MIPKEDIKVGLKFIARSNRKHKRVQTLVDIHKTYNLAGELVQTRYVAVHDFMGQQITQDDLVLTSIQLGEKVE